MRKKYALSILLLISAHCYAMQTQFFVHDQEGEHLVKRYDVSPFLRTLTPTQLKKFKDVGNRIRAIKFDNGDYRIQEDCAINGGGGFLGAIAVAATLVGGGVATAGLTLGALVTGGPVAAGATAVIGAKATCAAAVYVGIVTTIAPTP
jgi:hypothetical protein